MRNNPRPHKARKRFGQNFLHDDSIIQRILSALKLYPADQFVEIGPGLGALTLPLLAQLDQLDVIELDRDLVARLQELPEARSGKLNIHSGDVLKFDLCDLQAGREKLRLLGNLPYNISTPLIFHLLDQLPCIADAHFMLQQEVVNRLVAQPGTKAWGRLGIMVQLYCRVEEILQVPPSAFQPAPKVDSAVVRLVPHQSMPVEIADMGRFRETVKRAFSQRRKTLRNTLKGYIDEAAIRQAGIDPGARAESLSIAAFAALSCRAPVPVPD